MIAPEWSLRSSHRFLGIPSNGAATSTPTVYAVNYANPEAWNEVDDPTINLMRFHVQDAYMANRFTLQLVSGPCITLAPPDEPGRFTQERKCRKYEEFSQVRRITHLHYINRQGDKKIDNTKVDIQLISV